MRSVFNSDNEICDLDEVKLCKGFKLCHLNIRSVLPKWEEVKLNLLEGEFAVVGLTVTWLHKGINDNFLIQDGYSLVS